MGEGAKEQLLFEQYIRGLPKFVYENIRTSPVVKTTEEAMKRPEVVIHMHEVLTPTSENVATIKTVIDNSVMENTHSGMNEKYLSQDAIDEAVRVITEKISKTNSADNQDYVCSIQRGRGRFY